MGTLVNSYDSHMENLDELHKLLVKDLLRQIKEGTATPAAMAVALKVLQHNNVQCNPQADQNLLELADKVPFPRLAEAASA